MAVLREGEDSNTEGGVEGQPEDEGSKKTKESSRCAKCCSRLEAQPWMPSWQRVSRYLSVFVAALSLWGVAVSVASPSAAPGGQMFTLMLLCGTAHLAGRIVELAALPPLFGMMLAGVVLKNTGLANFEANYQYVAAVLRKASIAIIMTSAGLELDPASLRRLSVMVLRLAVIPAMVEGIALMVAAYFLLDLPWLWGALLGAVMGAISPAVVIPCLYSLQRRGFSVDNGISTLIIAAASLDDVVGVSLFGVLISIIFSSGDLTWRILQGPIGLLIGVVFGTSWGLLSWFIPHRDDPHVTPLRTLMLVGGGLLAVMGSEAVGYDAAGTLGCILSSFVACHGWRQQGWDNGSNPVAAHFGLIWDVFEPMLFAFIGAELDFQELDSHSVGLGIAVMCIALAFRMVASVGVAYGGSFTMKEKLFIAFAWFPKATVQAALGPVALDVARLLDPPQPEQLLRAHTVLVVAVMGIVLTAPVGAAIISLAGPRLLARHAVPARHHDVTSTRL
ncbi:sodium/hydrogen exchanger 9B2 [Anabrus simplex]|uniref:sodium/hydrogen exchanger 9B2 n=1 Tax=Anabrus simplex TaxID=316456 RepID=UPI0035A39B90